MTTKSRQKRLAVASHRRPSALRMRDWRVGMKLAAVLTIPLVGFLVVAGVQIGSSIGTASNLDTFARQVAAGRQVTALVHELQRERDRTAGVLAALAAPTPGERDTTSLAPDWTAVDRAVEGLRAAAEPLLRDPALAQAYQRADALLGQLAQVRAGASQGWLRTQAAFEIYTRAIASLQALLPSPSEVGGDTALGQVMRGFTNLVRAKELTAQIRGHLYIVCSTAAFQPGEFERIADVRAEQQAAIERFRADATTAQLAQFDDTVTGQAVSNANRLLREITGSAQAAQIGVDPLQWWLASTTQLELMRSVEEGLLQGATDGVGGASDQQWRTTLAGSVATLVLLLFAVALSVVIGRTTAKTLRSLREQALQIAQHRLPQVIEQLRAMPTKAPPLHVEPVVINTRDEVGEVAEAFTAVHRSAVRLAAEQAHMRRNVNEIFIKLARRSQALVERQLKLLDTMESAETEPNQLANFFRLDHLATRLRRNDANLLVLADGDTIRHWDAPVELNTVVLAATAEIEHYTRVRHSVPDNIYIVGYAVTDLVHLVAELLENATAFSPPATTVSVQAQSTVDGGAELIIADGGIGMSPEAIAQANHQLAFPMSIDVSAAERMGLVVVGHLAKRHNIRVLLGDGAPGVVVSIGIPAKLVSPAPAEQPSTLEPARWLRGDGADAAVPGDPAAIRRRAVATRAEDVLGHGRVTTQSVWWSKDGNGHPGTAAKPSAAAPEQPAVHGKTSAGLPKRTRVAARATAAAPVSGPPALDPAETGSMLSRLYGGLRRADSELESPTTVT